MMSHGNMIYQGRRASADRPVARRPLLSFLPLCHIAERKFR
jgi:long-subunit acyl-CoA synthetase (AMP-forming)